MIESWDGDAARAGDTAAGFVLELDGFEGPIDLLLALAREQKVDLARLSILQLANQYLDFIARARSLRLEIAADYLVMAAWLAYLKSRLLLPEPAGEDDEPSGAELAAALAFQLQRLEAMRRAGEQLMHRPQLGRDFFARGEPSPVRVRNRPVYRDNLYDLLRAYAGLAVRRQPPLRIEPSEFYGIEAALQRLNEILGHAPDWRSLLSFIPADALTPVRRRSALAAAFAASLELVRSGRAHMRQDGLFAPIYVRRAEPASAVGAPAADGRFVASS